MPPALTVNSVGGHGNPDVFTDRLRHALWVKRTQQAYDRFQKSGLTQDHCVLIEKALWQFAPFRGDGVSLYVQGKRPFGDRGVASSIYLTLGWPYPAEDRALTDDESERAWNVFDELIFALPVVAANARTVLWFHRETNNGVRILIEGRDQGAVDAYAKMVTEPAATTAARDKMNVEIDGAPAPGLQT